MPVKLHGPGLTVNGTCRTMNHAGGAYGRLRRFRGKVKFGVKLSELRAD